MMDDRPRRFNPFTRTNTIPLPPIDSVILNSVNANKGNGQSQYTPALLERLNNLKSVDEIEAEERQESILPKSDTSVDDIGEDVIVVRNGGGVTDIRKKIYNIIIGAFKAKKISDTSIYFILQTIPYIDIIDDVIVIYTKRMSIFEEIQIPCVNIALALKDGFKDKDMKVKFIPCNHITISDYFSKVNWDKKINIKR